MKRNEVEPRLTQMALHCFGTSGPGEWAVSQENFDHDWERILSSFRVCVVHTKVDGQFFLENHAFFLCIFLAVVRRGSVDAHGVRPRDER